MENSQLFLGSICVTDLIELANKKHSAFTKGNNGKIYCNVSLWYNQEPDKFGNHLGIKANPLKDKKEADGAPYIGNAKKSERQAPQPINENDASGLDIKADIETRPVKSDIPQDDKELPF